MAFEITYDMQVPEGARQVLVPGGLTTPHGRVTQLTTNQGQVSQIAEEATGQTAFLVTPDQPSLSITWHFDHVGGRYPDTMFAPRASRFTRFAEDLMHEAEAIADGLVGIERARALACAAAERFTYGHPEDKFNEGLDEVPALGCGMVEGSCVDINTYFIAALRAARIEAGYVTGFYFPTEKAGRCADGHCWVVTRIDGQTQEWDIAHHLKMGTRDIHPGLNPKPGFRAGAFHSMGLRFAQAGSELIKALIHPLALADDHWIDHEPTQIRLRHAGMLAAE